MQDHTTVSSADEADLIPPRMSRIGNNPPNRTRRVSDSSEYSDFIPYPKGRARKPRDDLPHVPTDPRGQCSNTESDPGIIESIIRQWRRSLPAFDLYYPDAHPALADFGTKITAVESFIIRKGLTKDISNWEDEKTDYFPIRVEDILSDASFCTIWKKFENDLFNNPIETITLWSVVTHKVVHDELLRKQTINETSSRDVGNPVISKIKAGFFQTEHTIPLISIKSALIGTFVTIGGSVIRSSDVGPYVIRMSFQCEKCKHEFSITQPDGYYMRPTKCANTTKCQNTTKFVTLESSLKTTVTDMKIIKLQDTKQFYETRGDVARTIKCKLLGGLTNQCKSGDTVTLSGIVKIEKAKTTPDGAQNMHVIYNEVTGIKKEKESVHAMGGHVKEFTTKDYYAINMIEKTPDLFRLLVASYCPAIFGHEMVKAGILLCLFGGTPREEGMALLRSNINMLMIGDPAMAKSQMLKMVTEVAPKAIYVCGTGSTVAGLTATIVREGDDITTEAGALLMADNGICCIDEFDKMKSQHHALLEAMEQQSVTITKSGNRTTHPARTGVIGAANPINGNYDTRKSVNENINIDAPLLSRFDLIFIMLDIPNKEFDQKLLQGMTRLDPKVQIPSPSPEDNNPEPAIGLTNKLKTKHGEILDLIPHVLIRKYIAYAKLWVVPQLTKEAAAVLKRFYTTSRLRHGKKDSTPITARQLESLIRLTQARAKLELREVATLSDAEEVLEIFEHGTTIGEERENWQISGYSDFLTGFTQPKSRKKMAKHLLAGMQRAAINQSKTIFAVQELKQIAAQCGIKCGITHIIDALNDEGILLKRGNLTYELKKLD